MSGFLSCVPHKVNAYLYTDLLMWKFVSNNIFDFVLTIFSYHMRQEFFVESLLFLPVFVSVNVAPNLP